MVTFRELEPEEFKDVPEEALGGFELPTVGCRVFAAIDEVGKIAAIWVMLAVMHIEPLWIRGDHRRSPTILRRLWNMVSDAMDEMGLKAVFSMILDSNTATTRLAEWLDARVIPGKVVMLVAGRK